MTSMTNEIVGPCIGKFLQKRWSVTMVWSPMTRFTYDSGYTPIFLLIKMSHDADYHAYPRYMYV